MASLALPIGLISSLNRAEEVSVPRWPLEFTKDCGATRNSRSTDSPDKGGGNNRGADSNGVALAWHAGDTEADIDVLIAGGAILAGVPPQGSVLASGSVSRE